MNRAATPATAIGAEVGATPAGKKPAWRTAAAAPFGYLRLRKEGVRRALNSEHYVGEGTKGAAWQFLFRLGEKAIGGANEPVMVGRVLHVHPSLHPCLLEPSNKADKLARGPRDRRAIVAARVAAMRAAGVFARVNGSRLGGVTRAAAAFCAERGGRFAFKDGRTEIVIRISPRSLARWEAEYRGGGADALVDGRGRFTRADGLSEEAIECFRALRHGPNRLSIRQAWRLTKKEAARKQWIWFSKYSTCAAWDRRTRDERGLVLTQGGDLAYAQHAGRWIEPDPESFEPGECWIGDDSTVDVWVRTPRGEIVRPVVSTWMDWRSRAITGIRLTHSGTETSLLLAFRQGADEFGLPAFVHVDNGRNFSAWSWTGGAPKRRSAMNRGDAIETQNGVFALCGIQPQWATPYCPNSKARLERWFRTLTEQLWKSFASYCGGCPDDRPEVHKALVARGVEWDELVEALRRFVAVYMDTPHSGEGMKSRTPRQVIATAPVRRAMPDAVRELCLQLWHRPVSIGRNGVAVRIAGTTVRYGWDEPALRALPIGTKVRIGYEPEDLSAVTVWTIEYGFICRAAANRRFNRKIASDDLRQTMREIAREKRTLRQAREAGTEYLRDPVERTLAALAADADERRLPDPPGPEGGLLLIPVRTPIEVPSKSIQPLRKAVGAEVGAADAAASVNPDADNLSDMQKRFAALAEKSRADRAARATDSVYERLGQFVRGSGT